MKKHIYKFGYLIAIVATLISCNVEEYSDLNNAEANAFNENLTRGDLQDLIGGILYSSRVNLGNYFDNCAVIGREYWRFSGSDPRFTTDLLGGGTSALDNNTFYITNPWAARYRTVKNANLILEFIEGQDLSAQFTTAEISGTRGFLKTFIAYDLLLNLNLTDQNGIRTDVSDPNNLGPFVSKSEALTTIRSLLVEAGQELANGGDEFPFVLSSGFVNFDQPNSFLQFNKAISARVAAYQNDAPGILSFLGESFFQLNSSELNFGVFYSFSEEATGIINPLFISVSGTSASNARVAHPSFAADAEAGDNRVSSKTALLPGPITLDNLTNDRVLFLYTSTTATIPIIRNEELILLYAEANITLNPAETVNALNIIRNSAGLPPYTGPIDQASLLTELLNQRRYALYAEGHRWIDMRRYNRLGELPIDRIDENGEPDNVWDMFPIPLTENQ